MFLLGIERKEKRVKKNASENARKEKKTCLILYVDKPFSKFEYVKRVARNGEKKVYETDNQKKTIFSRCGVMCSLFRCCTKENKQKVKWFC